MAQKTVNIDTAVLDKMAAGMGMADDPDGALQARIDAEAQTIKQQLLRDAFRKLSEADQIAALAHVGVTPLG